MFNFGTPANPPKAGTVTGALTSTPAATGSLQFNLGQSAGSGDGKTGSTLFPAASGSSLGFGANLSQPKQMVAPTLNFGAPATTPGSLSSGFGSVFSSSTTAATTAPGLSFGFGSPAATNIATSAPPNVSFALGTPASTAAPTSAPSLSFGFGSAATPTSAAGLSFGTGAPATTASTPGLAFGFGASSGTTSTSTPTFTPILTSTAATSSAPSGLKFGTTPTATTSATKPLLSGTPAIATTTTAAAGFSLGSVATSASVATTQSAPATAPVSTMGSLTFVQLEDSINKWTIDLEEQGKFFINQARQLNAWDGLLISNGEKILNLNSSIEKVKQQQSQLDQELDFILAQQKELEELIVPLEKELVDTPIVDLDRSQMYQYSEIIDFQLKQISDDLKEVIESINESNKDEEISNPITQISKILNAHMNSLQWIDRNTAQINRRLEEIAKIEETNRKNFTVNNSFSLYQ